MVGGIRVVDVAQVEGFDAVVDSIEWDRGAPEDLCAILTAQGLGGLALSSRPNMATMGETGIRSVLFFVDLHPDDAVMTVPRNLQTVVDLTGNSATVQNPFVAKGLGVLGGNTPGALASHYARSERAALREIKVNGIDAIWTDPDVIVIRGLIRHGLKMMRASAGNSDANLPTSDAGTNREILNRSVQLGDHTVAIMPLSPVNVIRQRFRNTPELARRGHILANGLVEPPTPDLQRIGAANIPQPIGLLRRLLQ